VHDGAFVSFLKRVGVVEAHRLHIHNLPAGLLAFRDKFGQCRNVAARKDVFARPGIGEARLASADVTALPFYRRAMLGLAYLPEQPSIFRGLTVEQNILSMLEIVEPVREQRDAKLEEILESLDLARLRKASANSLSGGERRRCEVAKALALDPAIMLLDEPFSGIDPLTIASIKQLIREMRTRGIGILLTDQNVPEMLSLIERAYVLDEGRVIFSGTPDEMMRAPLVIEHYLGRKPAK
jgi:lipopolysaccharide export system ATP-binding protein